ncbi:unnamed protein product [Durusdinium trenchii]
MSMQPGDLQNVPSMASRGTLHSQVSAGAGAAFQLQSAMPAMGSCGTMHSQSSACASAAFQPQSVGSCQVDGVQASNFARGHSTSRLNEFVHDFPIGCQVSALDEMVMRAEEQLKSEQVAVVEEGSLMDVLAHGSEPSTRRLYVRAQSGLSGWISCVAQSGRPLVGVVQPAPISSRRSFGARSTALDQEGGPELERTATMQSQLAAGVTTTVTTMYPAQLVTEDVVSGQQWLRRQKAQDLREEAPKRFLVDNRLLNAGTDGISYRFSQDLEDLDLSCTASWGSIVEGVDEGDWIRVSDELYLPKMLGGVPVLTLEDTPWALSGLQVQEAFPVSSEVVILEAAIMRAAEELRSAAVAQLEKDRRLEVLGHGAGVRSRRLYVQDLVSGQTGWISFAAQNGKLLVAPTDAAPDEVQKVATMATHVATMARQYEERVEGGEERQEEPPEEAFFVDNRMLKADSDGIGYRASPDLDDKAIPPRTALWGSVVHGVDNGDWLRVGAYFLPKSLCGVNVLTPKEEVPASHLPQHAGFARGDWEYVCVDPQGVMTHVEPQEVPSKPSGQAVQPGELIRICERGMLGQKLWLCLMDGRGWLMEKSSKRHVSEVNTEGVQDPNMKQKLIVDPRLEKPVMLSPAPMTFAAVAGAPQLLAGMVVSILRKVQVLLPSPTDRKKETWARYYKVEDERKIEGWLGELRMHCGIKGSNQGEPVLCEFQAGFHDPRHRGRPCWVSVVSKSSVQLLQGPGRNRNLGKTLSCGDFLEAMEQLQAAGQTYYRLADGWVARDDPSGKIACDLVVRELHQWVYVCNDKDGAQIRETPTRSNTKNKGKRLKYRQRVSISERVTTSANDVFLKLADDKKGWVPATKLNSNVVKMAPLQPLQPMEPQRPMAGCLQGVQGCGACGHPQQYAHQPALQQCPPTIQAPLNIANGDPYANGGASAYMPGYGGCSGCAGCSGGGFGLGPADAQWGPSGDDFGIGAPAGSCGFPPAAGCGYAPAGLSAQGAQGVQGWSGGFR